MLSLAVLVAGRRAMRPSGSTAAFGITCFVWAGAVYFAVLLRWLGIDRVFNGESLEAFGVLVLLAVSGVAAAITAAVLSTAMGRWKRTHSRAE